MRIAIIAALAENHVIGNDNTLPWHLSEDLKHFKATTLGKPVIMGRKTFSSIGKPLPNRENIIVTRQQDLNIPGCKVVNCLDSALNAAIDSEEVMIIGGSNLYRQMLPLANHMYLTIIHKSFEGDSHFPHWPEDEWQKIKQDDCYSETAQLDYSFVEYQRIKAPKDIT